MEGKSKINGLADFLREAAELPEAPVEQWNPPYCGDIGLAIRSDGTWEHQGSPIRRPAMVKLFARILRKDADGRHYLVTPAEKVDVHVMDAPFLAIELAVDGTGTSQLLTFRTNVDDIVQCNKDHPLRFVEQVGTGGLKPYLLVRGHLEARLTRSVYLDLVERSQLDQETGEFAVWSAGARFAMGRA